jgi:hypothetical protein
MSVYQHRAAVQIVTSKSPELHATVIFLALLRRETARRDPVARVSGDQQDAIPIL